MNLKDFEQLEEKLLEAERSVRDTKRPSYTAGSEDVLWNFKRDAQLAGIDPMQNWLAHFLKQVAAVVSIVRNPEKTPSEPLIDRMKDVRVYTSLGLALAIDRQYPDATIFGKQTQGKGTLQFDSLSAATYVHKDGDYE